MVKTDSAFLKEEKHLEMDKKAILGEMNDKNKEVQNLNLEIDTNPGGTAENIQVKKGSEPKGINLIVILKTTSSGACALILGDLILRMIQNPMKRPFISVKTISRLMIKLSLYPGRPL